MCIKRRLGGRRLGSVKDGAAVDLASPRILFCIAAIPAADPRAATEVAENARHGGVTMDGRAYGCGMAPICCMKDIMSKY